MLFQRTHLALLRAAVRFFQEEFGPHAADAFLGYLPEPDPQITTEHLHELQWLIENSRLRGGRLVTDSAVIQLLPHGESALQSNEADFVAVLMFVPSQAGHQFGE